MHVVKSILNLECPLKKIVLLHEIWLVLAFYLFAAFIWALSSHFFKFNQVFVPKLCRRSFVLEGNGKSGKMKDVHNL